MNTINDQKLKTPKLHFNTKAAIGLKLMQIRKFFKPSIEYYDQYVAKEKGKEKNNNFHFDVV